MTAPDCVLTKQSWFLCNSKEAFHSSYKKSILIQEDIIVKCIYETLAGIIVYYTVVSIVLMSLTMSSIGKPSGNNFNIASYLKISTRTLMILKSMSPC